MLPLSWETAKTIIAHSLLHTLFEHCVELGSKPMTYIATTSKTLIVKLTPFLKRLAVTGLFLTAVAIDGPAPTGGAF